MGDWAIRVKDLRKQYTGRDGPIDALQGLDLEVPVGECFGLLGPNGAGKTTTVEILEGLNQPTSGDVEVLGLRWATDETAIREREGRGETTETRFVSIDKADVTGAEVRNKAAQITVRFVSQLVSVTHDRTGAVIEGSPEKVTEVTDVWTFARDISSRDPNWKLVATEAGQ